MLLQHSNYWFHNYYLFEFDFTSCRGTIIWPKGGILTLILLILLYILIIYTRKIGMWLMGAGLTLIINACDVHFEACYCGV